MTLHPHPIVLYSLELKHSTKKTNSSLRISTLFIKWSFNYLCDFMVCLYLTILVNLRTEVRQLRWRTNVIILPRRISTIPQIPNQIPKCHMRRTYLSRRTVTWWLSVTVFCQQSKIKCIVRFFSLRIVSYK